MADNTPQVKIYPNPSSEATTISYILSAEEKVTIEVYNLIGQKISTIIDGEAQNAGEHIYQYHCPAAGIYILKIQQGGQISEKKLVQIKLGDIVSLQDPYSSQLRLFHIQP